MSIPISDIIQVNIAVAPNAVATDGFGPMLFLSKEFVSTGSALPVLTFTSLKEVQDQFPTGEISKAATAWYSQKPQPKTFCVGALATTTTTNPTPATLSASTAAVLADIKAITDGSMTVMVDGISKSITAMDFSAAADFGAVVTRLNLEFSANNIGLTASQTSGKFVLTTVSTGKSASVTNASGNLATALKLTTALNVVAVSGQTGKSVQDDLAKIMDTGVYFFFVGVEAAQRAKGVQSQIAKWAEANGKVFGWEDSDSKILTLGDTTNSFYQAKSLNLRNTLCVYDASQNADEYPAVSILGRAATVNFNVANSVLILAYKKGPSITTANLSSGQKSALESYNGNAFIDVGGNVMFWNGKMADGTWFDTVQGVEWLTQKVRNNVFNLFYTSTTKIPWTDTGVALVNQQVTLALELARTNGLIAPGYDNEGVFYPDGYKVISTDLSLLQSQKGARIWEGTSFIAIGSGALQGAVISGTFVQ